MSSLTANLTTTGSTTDSNGAFVRQLSQYRHWVTADGSAGPTGSDGFQADANRYHLYVSLNCPWAHRALIFRALKKLENVISVSVVFPQRTEKGWAFRDYPDCSADPVLGAEYLAELYHHADRDYNGRYTVPLLWDKQQQTIVSNESADIIRMFNSAFDAFTEVETDFYPEALQAAINTLNDRVYRQVNNGVYRAGFAKSQQAYEEAFDQVFEGLDYLETRLQEQRYLLGDTLTEADWRLFPTLLRFDLVYYSLFKCNKKRLADYPHLSRYTRELYHYPGIAATVNVHHIKQGYWRRSERNPLGIVPVGPDIDYLMKSDHSTD